jgi:cell division protein ZipA
MWWIVGIAVAILGMLMIRFYDQRNGGMNPAEQAALYSNGDLYAVPASASRSRITALGLDKATDDASHILDEASLNFPRIKRDFENAEYKADPNLHWIMDIRPAPSAGIAVFQKSEFVQLFDLDWRTNYGPTMVFGKGADDGKWTYVMAGDSPETYDELQVAIAFANMAPHEEGCAENIAMELTLKELDLRLKQFSFPVDAHPSDTLEAAREKGTAIIQLNDRLRHDVTLVLKSDSAYHGRDAWNVLLNLGLKWGDGDLFHWENYKNDYGDDFHFSVWTATDPGYFMPEWIKDGSFHPNELVFGYGIPRNADPEGVFEVMLNAALYCQKNLGGTLLTETGERWNTAAERERLNGIVSEMKAISLVPGSDAVLKRI